MAKSNKTIIKFSLAVTAVLIAVISSTIISTYLGDKATESIRIKIKEVNGSESTKLKSYKILDVEINSPAEFKKDDLKLSKEQLIKMGIASSEAYSANYSKSTSESVVLSVSKQVHKSNIQFDPESARIETANKWKSSLKLSNIKEQNKLISINEKKCNRTLIEGALDGIGPQMEITLITYHNKNTFWMIQIVLTKNNKLDASEIIQSLRFTTTQ